MAQDYPAWQALKGKGKEKFERTNSLSLPFRIPATLACTQTLFYFSFPSFRKHRRAKGALESERATKSAEPRGPTHIF